MQHAFGIYLKKYLVTMKIQICSWMNKNPMKKVNKKLRNLISINLHYISFVNIVL